MDNLIERYVNDVTRRLPEKDRDEVSKELKSNIYDMLSDNTDKNEIETVLYELGSPAFLAEKYRQKPRYLISPAIYDDYVRVLKRVLPLVGIVALAIGMIFGAVDSIKDGMVDISYFISSILSQGISMGVSAAFQALVWTTAGFAIAERTSAKSGENKMDEWKIEDLPEEFPNDNGKIPLSDSIIKMSLTIIFSVVAIAACSGIFPVVFAFQNSNTQIRAFFSSSFLSACIPAIVVMALFGVCECISKIIIRKWTPLVCCTVILSALVNLGVFIYLINRPDIFSEESSAFLQGVNLGSFDLLRLINANGINVIIVPIGIIIVVCSLVECFNAVRKTVKGS